MADGFEIDDPSVLHKAASVVEAQCSRTASDGAEFEAAARVDPDAWGKTSKSWEMANNYDAFFSQVVQDCKDMSKALKGFSAAVDAAGTNYEAMEKANTVTVRPGQTLWGIARQRSGQGSNWPEIAAKNPEITDPNLIHPGDRVRLPGDPVGPVK